MRKLLQLLILSFEKFSACIYIYISVVSGKTRTNQGVNSTFNRRCVTPEPVSSHVKERKQLILDLRFNYL